MVSISACRTEDPHSITGGGVLVLFYHLRMPQQHVAEHAPNIRI